MPELPEVEAVCENLRSHKIESLMLVNIEVLNASSLTGSEHLAQILNYHVSKIFRRGKYIVFRFENGYYLTIHLKMSGRLNFSTEQDKYARVIFKFCNNKNLVFSDVRKFGRVALLTASCFEKLSNHLGLEPLSPEFTFTSFIIRLERLTGIIKNILLQQEIVAGIGNIYASEVLWYAGISPFRRANKISRKRLLKMYTAIKYVLSNAVKNLGTSLGDGANNFILPSGESGRNRENIAVYGREGLKCIICDTIIKRSVIAQRSTFYCPKCQR